MKSHPKRPSLKATAYCFVERHCGAWQISLAFCMWKESEEEEDEESESDDDEAELWPELVKNDG